MSPATRNGLAFATVLTALAAGSASAASGSGGTSSVGGATFVETPKIAKVACVRACATRQRLQAGSTVRISGRSLGQVTSAVFLGSPGSRDDVRVKVRRLDARRVRAKVPASAVTGPIALVTAAAVASAPSRAVAILPPLPATVLSVDEHVFPIAGKHDFGGAGSTFGADRGGRSHQGHDVFARCGTPLVAARGGRVQERRYHAAAGHYVVIDTADGTDYVYMHLAERSPFSRGDSVATGQRIGAVGDSGNARGCHLHFELWSAPGYYEGGRPLDPFPALKAWAA